MVYDYPVGTCVGARTATVGAAVQEPKPNGMNMIRTLSQPAESKGTLSPVATTLRGPLHPKSFPCRSYELMGGGGTPPRVHNQLNSLHLTFSCPRTNHKSVAINHRPVIPLARSLPKAQRVRGSQTSGSAAIIGRRFRPCRNSDHVGTVAPIGHPPHLPSALTHPAARASFSPRMRFHSLTLIARPYA